MLKNCNERDNPSSDRISSLPRELRLRILALLSRKEAVRTCILSTRWKNLWKSRFPYETLLEFKKEYTDEQAQDQFVGGVNENMLSYRDKKIESFTLSLNPGVKNEATVKNWIQQAVSCGVENLFLDFSQGLMSGHFDDRIAQILKRPVLTGKLFEKNILFALHLCYCSLQSRTFKFNAFCCLETLYLDHIKISDAKLVKAIAHCKLLQKLWLNDCMMLRHIKVSGPELKLKLLSVVNCWQLASLEISSPKLESIYLAGKMPPHCAFIDISSLVAVTVDPTSEDYNGEPLIALNQVESLSLSGSAIQQFVEHEPFQPGMLSNVRTLCFSSHGLAQFNVTNIYKLLKSFNFPQLRELPIQLPACVYDLILERSLNASHAELRNITFENLKKIQLNNFHVSCNHISFLKYFLDSAVALETVTLVLPTSYLLHDHEPSLATLIDALNLLRRASVKAKFSVIYPTRSGGSAKYPV